VVPGRWDEGRSHQSIVSITFFSSSQIATSPHSRYRGWRRATWHGARSSLIIAHGFYAGERQDITGAVLKMEVGRRRAMVPEIVERSMPCSGLMRLRIPG
jgi:hypothetical protein